MIESTCKLNKEIEKIIYTLDDDLGWKIHLHLISVIIDQIDVEFGELNTELKKI